MSFSAALEAALAGTLRQAPPDVPLGPPSGHASEAPEATLLRAAAIEGLRRLAGRPVALAGFALPNVVEPSPPETLAEVPPAAAARLFDLLDQQPDLLPEWFDLAAQRDMRVPFGALPDLLDFMRTEAESDPQLRARLRKIGGERLAWLASHNPDWAFAATHDPERVFVDGSRDQRRAALERIRDTDPSRARTLLADAWSSEPHSSRAALLQVLATHLSLDDEPLLEQALSSAGRKEVRDAALRLLARLPDSHFANRWRLRAQTAIELRRQGIPGFRGDSLTVQPPAEPPPDWIADGLDVAAPKGLGPSAWLVQQIMAFTPPDIWPLDAGILDTFARTDWFEPLQAGLGQAAASYRHPDWCDHLLDRWADAQEKRGSVPLNGQALYAALDQPRAEATFMRLCERGIAGPSALAGVRSDQWSPDFSAYMLRTLPRAIERWQYSAIGLLRDAPLRMDPSSHASAVHLLDSLPASSSWALLALERLVSTLELRATMRAEFGATQPSV